MTTGTARAEHDDASATSASDAGRSIRLGIGVGLLLSGVVLVALSAFAPEHPVWQTLRATRGYLAVLFAVGGLGLVFHRRTLPWRVLVILVAAVFLYGQVGHLARSEYGFAPPGSGWSILGGWALVLGALVVPGRGGSRRGRGGSGASKRSLISIGAAAVAAALAAGLAPVATAVADDAPVDSVTAPQVVVPDVPARIEGTEAWRVDLSGVTQVDPGGAGFILSHQDGVTALDGTTGETRWHYGRPGAHRKSTFVSPDGGTVLVRFDSRVEGRYVVLDAVTGEVRHQGERLGSIIPGGSSALFVLPVTELLTDSAVVRIDDSHRPASQLAAASLADGQELWRWTPPMGCQFNENAWGTITTGDRVVVTVLCGPDDGDVTELRLHGLVDTTGEQVWDRVVELPERPEDYPDNLRHGADWPFYVERGPDDLIGYSPQRFYRASIDNLVLDAADGTEIARSLEAIDFLGPRIVLRDDAGHSVLAPRTEEAALWESDDERLDRPCTRWNGLGLAAQAVCIPNPQNPLEYGEHFALGGTLDGPLVTTDPSGAQPQSLHVDLGGPFAVRRGSEFSSGWLAVLAGPGAVAVHSEVPPVEGASRELVGLR